MNEFEKNCIVTTDKKYCQSMYSQLVSTSYEFRLFKLFKVLWILKKNGFLWALKLILKKLKIIRNPFINNNKVKKKLNHYDIEILDLQPGELIEVKSEKEIRKTLDNLGRSKGLGFMPEMYKYCGKRFRVYKILKQIMLESTGEVRRIKNTVLLEGVICDGSEHYNCDRSCFHFWREVWLKRSKE